MVVKMEDVGYFHKEEIIIAQHKLDEIDITDNDQLITFISDLLGVLEDRVYTSDIHIEFENYEAMMDAIMYHNNKVSEYLNVIYDRLPDCAIKIGDNKIFIHFIGNVSHSVSIIAKLLKIDAKKIENTKINGEYIIHL